MIMIELMLAKKYTYKQFWHNQSEGYIYIEYGEMLMNISKTNYVYFVDYQHKNSNGFICQLNSEQQVINFIETMISLAQ